MSISNLFNHFSTIKNKIFAITLLLLFLFTTTSILLFYFFSKMYEERIYGESAESLLIWSTILDEELKKVEKLSFQISTDSFIQLYLETLKENQHDYQAYKTKMMMTERLVAYANLERYITSVQITDFHRDTYVGGYDAHFSGDFEMYSANILTLQGANVWGNLQENSLLSAREIRRTENLRLDHLGILGITIDMNMIVKDLLKLPSDRGVIITTGNKIFYNDFQIENATIIKLLTEISQNSRGYEITNIQDKKYFITYKTSENADLTYFNILPYDNIAEKTKVITHLMIAFILFLILLTVLVSRLAAKAISQPIEQLTGKMKQVKNGNFEDLQIDGNGLLKDEIGEMQKHFVLMLEEINRLIKENYQKQLIIKETQYKALQAQINPHFLYNTLDSINWLARINKQHKISSLAEALGNMMRNILSKKDPLITIKEEFDIVHHYVTIQKYRYENRLNVKIIEINEMNQYTIPKLTIQPIVENAIQHGLEEMITECEIVIYSEYSDEDLRIIVKDNGPGMEEDTIQTIFNGKVQSKGTGIGLFNINERIKLMFGNEYGIHIESKKDVGTKVTVTLPFITR